MSEAPMKPKDDEVDKATASLDAALKDQSCRKRLEQSGKLIRSALGVPPKKEGKPHD